MTGQWLSTRLKRTFVVPDGVVSLGAGGSLLVHSGPNSGWVRFRPGRAPRLEGKRFPKPQWESAELNGIETGNPAVVTEPLPGGLWIRPGGETEAVALSRSRLISGMAFQPEVLSIVVGGPDLPPVAPADVAEVCRLLPVACRAQVRFVEYGPSPATGVATFGHSLANLLGGDIVCYGGMPIHTAAGCEVFTVRPDGTLGWNMFAQQLVYRPQATPILAGAPEVYGYRRPAGDGLTEVAPAVYAREPDVVVEVVRSGLWVRPANGVANAGRIRSIPADPLAHFITFEAADVEQAGRMRAVAEDVLAQIDPPTRDVTRLVPATTVHSARVKDISRELTETDLAALDLSVPTTVVASPALPLPEAPGVSEDPEISEIDLAEDNFFAENATVVDSPLTLTRMPSEDLVASDQPVILDGGGRLR
ncbi:hypothetical protein [Amycolatopsis sp. EV170708-02-1]|uniref:hypothetical protein n=1 Tax=Amycolatopsis sp. EV170708-02-1 TaxID=2919322 RepID=UPI001F0BFE2A|nr:hypothetical protein [Amycolatopsis sp. EV170708-02-1]UMP06975.1 hypothetical protein MJQ72_20130 [Amycolatopsis sp. EV170708-02-1]